jgi:hypothetical protein
MVAGYNHATSPKLTEEQLYLLPNAGDLEDLINLPAATSTPNRADKLGTRVFSSPIVDRTDPLT